MYHALLALIVIIWNGIGGGALFLAVNTFLNNISYRKLNKKEVAHPFCLLFGEFGNT